MSELLIVRISVISTVAPYAHQQPDAAKLKADAQKFVSIIEADTAKTQAHCQINDLSDQVDEVDQQKDRKKVEALVKKMNELEKQLGPECLALVKATEDVGSKFQRRPGGRVDIR